jgi:hypothetical protein
VRDGLDRVVKAVAALSAVAEDLVGLQSADRMLDSCADAAMLRVVGFLAGQQGPAGSFAVRDDKAGIDVGAVAEHGDPLALVRQAGDAPHVGIGLVARSRASGGHHQTGSTSMMTCTFTEKR